MTALQKFREKLFFQEETSDQQRSICLVDIMNVIWFSKCEREIHRHDVHLNNVLLNIFRPTDNLAIKITGSTSQSMCGDNYGNQGHHDSDCLLTGRHIILYTPRTNNINTLHCYPYMTMKIMMHLILSKKMTTFQNMLNYHSRKRKTNVLTWIIAQEWMMENCIYQIIWW